MARRQDRGSTGKALRFRIPCEGMGAERAKYYAFGTLGAGSVWLG
jgi:hypothetical protein